MTFDWALLVMVGSTIVSTTGWIKTLIEIHKLRPKQSRIYIPQTTEERIRYGSSRLPVLTAVAVVCGVVSLVSASVAIPAIAVKLSKAQEIRHDLDQLRAKGAVVTDPTPRASESKETPPLANESQNVPPLVQSPSETPHPPVRPHSTSSAATTLGQAQGPSPNSNKHRVDTSKLQDGDLVFIRSHSANAGAISDVTHSGFTHCGIVFNVNGIWKVREGAGRETDYSDIDAWQDRESTDHKTKKTETYEPITVRRLIAMKNWSEKETAEKIGKLQKEAQKLHETKYDSGFAWNNHYTVQNGTEHFSTNPEDKDYVYCSELIYKAFDRALTIKLGTLKTIANYSLTEEAKKILDNPEGMRRRGNQHYRLDEQVISPQDVYISDLLETVDVATP